MSDPEDFIEEDDLFGDDDAGDAEPVRHLSDEELDSGDDEARKDRVPDGMEVDDRPQREARIMDASLGRQTIPMPTDGQIHTFRLPKFLGLDPMPYESSTFQLPEYDHHTKTTSENFSAATVADTTIRYQRNSSTGKLESNAYFCQWSDGSTTLHVGENDYELLSKPLAPTIDDSKDYQETLDSHQYLVTPHQDSQILQVVGHITNQYTVMANKQIADVALERLTSALLATNRGRINGENKHGIAVITQTQDPELQKKEAEQAEKERMKAQRRREMAAAKADTRIRSTAGGGLSLDDLEGRSSRLPGSARKKRAAPAGPKRARKRAEYSSDEDDRPGRHREDEYDMEDDFLAASDEEEEGEESEEDIDDGIMESPKPKKQKRQEADDDDDEDADGEPDDDAPTASGDATGRRKRLIIEDDDDE